MAAGVVIILAAVALYASGANSVPFAALGVLLVILGFFLAF